jgi:hypothetical protein
MHMKFRYPTVDVAAGGEQLAFRTNYTISRYLRLERDIMLCLQQNIRRRWLVGCNRILAVYTSKSIGSK